MKIGESYLLTLKLKSSLINKLYSKVVIISTFVALKTFTITGFSFFYFFKFLHTLLYFSSIFLRKWNIRRFFSLSIIWSQDCYCFPKILTPGFNISEVPISRVILWFVASWLPLLQWGWIPDAYAFAVRRFLQR